MLFAKTTDGIFAFGGRCFSLPSRIDPLLLTIRHIPQKGKNGFLQIKLTPKIQRSHIEERLRLVKSIQIHAELEELRVEEDTIAHETLKDMINESAMDQQAVFHEEQQDTHFSPVAESSILHEETIPDLNQALGGELHLLLGATETSNGPPIPTEQESAITVLLETQTSSNEMQLVPVELSSVPLMVPIQESASPASVPTMAPFSPLVQSAPVESPPVNEPVQATLNSESADPEPNQSGHRVSSISLPVPIQQESATPTDSLVPAVIPFVPSEVPNEANEAPSLSESAQATSISESAEPEPDQSSHSEQLTPSGSSSLQEQQVGGTSAEPISQAQPAPVKSSMAPPNPPKISAYPRSSKDYCIPNIEPMLGSRKELRLQKVRFGFSEFNLIHFYFVNFRSKEWTKEFAELYLEANKKKFF